MMIHLFSALIPHLRPAARGGKQHKDLVLLLLIAAFDQGEESVLLGELARRAKPLNYEQTVRALGELADLGMVSSDPEALTVSLAERVREERRLSNAVGVAIDQAPLRRPSALAG